MMNAMSTPEPVTVWMVHLEQGAVDKDYKGSIALGEDALVFSAAHQGGELPFTYAQVRRAKRLRTSPVLVLDWLDGKERRRTAFYFTEPPPLYPAARAPRPDRVDPVPSTPFGAFKRTGKHKAQRTNARYLQTYGIERKDEIQGWADAVNARVGSVR